MNIAKEKRAIEYLKAFEPEEEPYYLCYSGGKDSDTIKILAKLANVKHESVHNLTTADAPETVNYVKQQKDVKIDYPEITMWKLIEKKGFPPTRFARYCCEVLKERGGKGRLKITGVRKYESVTRNANGGIVKIIGSPKTTEKRAIELSVDYKINPKGGIVLNHDNDINRRFVERCYRTTSTMINPIIDWDDDDVWEFLKYYGCSSNPLYQCGFKRIGCIGCPVAAKARYKEFARYPKYKLNYIKAFDRMLLERERRGLNSKVGWTNGISVFKWWMEEDPAQISLFDEE